MILRPAVLFVSCLSFTSFSYASVQPRLMTVKEVTTNQNSVSARVLSELDKKETRDRIQAMGLSPDEARARVAGMSESELRELMKQNGVQEAGGDVFISLTTILLIVIIVLLLR